MKTLLRIAVVLVLLILVVLGGLWFGLDGLLRRGVEQGGTRALGVPTRLDSVHLSVSSGRLSLSGLEVDNPPGFEARPFLKLGTGNTQVELDSLRSDVVRVPTLELADVELLLQRREGRSNYGTILDNLERFSGKDGKPPAEEDPDAKRFMIGSIVIKNVVADFDLLPVGGQLTRAKVTIPLLTLENVGTAEGGATLAQITARVVEALLQASLQGAGGVLSPELLRDLESQLRKLGAETLKLPEGVLGDLIEGMPPGVETEIEKKANDAIKDLGKELGGVLKKD
jgi:hypothetical protein